MPLPIICTYNCLQQYLMSYRDLFSKPQYKYLVTVLLEFIQCQQARTLDQIDPLFHALRQMGMTVVCSCEQYQRLAYSTLLNSTIPSSLNCYSPSKGWMLPPPLSAAFSRAFEGSAGLGECIPEGPGDQEPLYARTRLICLLHKRSELSDE